MSKRDLSWSNFRFSATCRKPSGITTAVVDQSSLLPSSQRLGPFNSCAHCQPTSTSSSIKFFLYITTRSWHPPRFNHSNQHHSLKTRLSTTSLQSQVTYHKITTMSLTTYPRLLKLPVEFQTQVYEHAFDEFFLTSHLTAARLLSIWLTQRHPTSMNSIAAQAGRSIHWYCRAGLVLGVVGLMPMHRLARWLGRWRG